MVEEALEEDTTLFLIDLSIKDNNAITVIIDGDSGVTIDDCMAFSRKVENNLDREEEDFSLEVMSAGAAEVFVNKRQYGKNKGRLLSLKMIDGTKMEGDLLEVDEDSITIGWNSREPKPVGKGKVTIHKEGVLAYEDIAEAKVKIKF